MKVAPALCLGLLALGALSGLIERFVYWLASKWRVILVVIGALAVAGCAPAVTQHYHWAGFAVWDCGEDAPVAFVRIDYLTNRDVVKHEREHLRQMVEVGCEVWHAQMERKAFRDSIEADAWRRVWVADGARR